MRRASLAALLAVAAACAHPERRDARTTGGEPQGDRARAERPTRAEVGIASFYAHRFHGRRTASGARYDMNALTCAHPSAAFGTRLRVTDLESGRAVVVTVNDRGPFARGRVVDLSLEAARRLGIVDRGLARVRVERLGEP